MGKKGKSGKSAACQQDWMHGEGVVGRVQAAEARLRKRLGYHLT